MYENEKHKVFISFKYEDVKYVEILRSLNENLRIFEDFSAHDGEINDLNLTDEQVRKIIRDDFVKQSSVTIVLVGNDMRESKFVDWELHASMSDYDNYPSTGILVIQLPTSPKKNIVNQSGIIKSMFPNWDWHPMSTDKDVLDKKYFYLPKRIVDNLNKSEVFIDVINWDDLGLSLSPDTNNLMKLIHFAFTKRKQKYDNSRPMKGR